MRSDEEKKKMLNLARKAIENHEDESKLKSAMTRTKLKGNSGVFVSVYVNNKLRGCIGNLNAMDIKEGISKNAIMAAYEDLRFESIRKDELSKMKIHINLLSKPKEIFPENAMELLKILETKPGLIIEKGFRSATFLPTVWDELPRKEDFLNHLCMKAGLPAEEWKKPGMKFYTYESEEFSE